NAGVAKIYVNGSLISASSAMTPYESTASTGYLRIGNGPGEQPWYGLIGDLRLSNIERTEFDIPVSTGLPPIVALVTPIQSIGPSTPITIRVYDQDLVGLAVVWVG